MKTLNVFLAIVASLCLSPAAWGQRALSSAEIQKILQDVTNRPRETWIVAGTITATHQEYGAPKTTNQGTIQSEINKAVQAYQNNSDKKEKTVQLQKMALDAIPFNVRYKLANEYSMSSRVTVRYDHGRFYWEINADSRQDSVRPADYGVAGNYMTRHFDMGWNQRRIAAWDGQKYTTYSASGNRATVDAAGKLPRAVNGPLTAGLIPWGHGRFTLASLTAAQASARDAGGMIDLTLTFTDGASAGLALDSARAYAVTKATLTSAGRAVAIHTCSGYQLVGGNWVPSKVTIERLNAGAESRLPTSEQWTFTSVSAAAPSPTGFNVPLGANALMEYAAPLAGSSAIYVQSHEADTDELLAQRLAYVAGAGSRSQNCATAALQTAAARLGKSLSTGALAGLVGPDGGTTLLEMKRFAQSQGLYCRAVRTDLAALRGLQGVQAILHIPGRSHFVVLNSADDRDVWLTDLSSRKFFYRQSRDFFPMDWPEGTALLLSNRPIPALSVELPDAVLATLAGGAGWECNTLLQEEDVFYCSVMIDGCSGAVTVYYERWGCGAASSGSCTHEEMVSSQETPCIWDPWYDCTTNGEWYYYYMDACG
jgi:hypothetical protein